MTGCTNPGKTQKKSNIQIGGNYKICDTCKTTIIVGHNECTDCADLQVDSGFIYISQNLFDQIDTMKKIQAFSHQIGSAPAIFIFPTKNIFINYGRIP